MTGPSAHYTIDEDGQVKGNVREVREYASLKLIRFVDGQPTTPDIADAQPGDVLLLNLAAMLEPLAPIRAAARRAGKTTVVHAWTAAQADVEEVAEHLAKADGWLSLRHPSPATQETIRERARALLNDPEGQALVQAIHDRKANP